MLRITIGGTEGWDEDKEEFVYMEQPVVLDLEHSLLAVSKWESKYQKPFLDSEKKTPDEVIDYLKFMVVTPDVDPDVLDHCTQENLDEIHAYMESNQSATTFGTMPERPGRGERITAELIYFWMANFSIWKECEGWHLNRLFSLIKIANIKNAQPGKKMSQNDIAQRNRELNAQRRAKLGTSG